MSDCEKEFTPPCEEEGFQGSPLCDDCDGSDECPFWPNNNERLRVVAINIMVVGRRVVRGYVEKRIQELIEEDGLLDEFPDEVKIGSKISISVSEGMPVGSEVL